MNRPSPSFLSLPSLLTILAGLVLSGLAAPKPAEDPAPIKLHTGSPRVAAWLEREGARLVADYGGFQILAAPAGAAAALAAASGAGILDEMDVIELNSGWLRTATPEAQAGRAPIPPFAGRRLHLVQFAAPVRPDWHAELLGTGVEVVAYIPHNAYLVYGDATALGGLRSWAGNSPFVQWDGPFRDEYRIHPDLLRKDAGGRATSAADDLKVIQLVADPLANAATEAVIEARRRGPVLKREAELNYVNVTVRIPAEAVLELAAQPDVVSIWPYEPPRQRDERQAQIVAGNLFGPVPSGPGYLEWLAEKGFTQAQFDASGFLVDVSDSGIDNGTTTPGHFGLYPEGNTDLPSRVGYNRLIGTPHTGTLQGCDGHGTIDAHIVAGYNAFAGFPFTDSEGYSYGLGIAPFVRVGSSVIFDPNSFTYPNFTELQSRAYADGARISANSWGQNNGGGYNTDSQIYDARVRDAQPANAVFPAPGNQEMVIVFSAGNAGPALRTVGAPATAKNVIAVGASENVHSFSTANGGNHPTGGDGCGRGDSAANSAHDMSDYSSRGPCVDGRKKPDLVAPGTHITGGVAQQIAPGPLGTAIPCFNAQGVCALPGKGGVSNLNNFFPLGQEFYTTSTGTSHAAPAVAGGAALLRQWFINSGQPPPSPAMTKAWLLNSARHLTGAYADDTLPSNTQGMGAMNLGRAFDGVPRGVFDQVPADKFTATGQTRTFTGTVRDTNQPFRVTLAWTDAPGSTVGGAFNNNLDLVVLVGGATYRGNVFDGPHSVPGGPPDTRNNVESVFLPPGVGGGFVITITAANIVSDGVPNDADPLDQDFALVLYNVELEDAPVIVAEGSQLLAESCASGNGAADPGEVVTFRLSLRNVGTAPTTNLVATLLPGGVVDSPGASADFGALSIGESVSREFTFRAVGECGATLPCRLWLTDGGTERGTVSFAIRLGQGSLGGHSFSNAQPIAIPNSGPATPYPSAIVVSGVPGTVTKVTVTVRDFGHDYPADVDLLLMNPAGATTLLLSRVGGAGSVTNVTLTFDDAAGSGVPAQIVSGTFLPTALGTIVLPPPAPASPYGATLSALTGVPANGLWQLFVNDHASGDSGAINEGWSLTLTTAAGVCCFDSDHANLELAVEAAPDPGIWESEMTWTLIVRNLGPANATNVTLTNWLANEVTFDSASVSQGTATHEAGVVVAALGTLAPGASATVVIAATVHGGDRLTNRAVVAMDTFDHDPGNNAVTTVSAAVEPELLIVSRVSLVGEDCGFGNQAVDPGEMVQVAFALQNLGTRKTTNVAAALRATDGVIGPSEPQSYGALAPGGPPVTNVFTFTAAGRCGETLLAELDLTDLAQPLMSLTNRLHLGQPTVALREDFDEVTAPDLPQGWTATLSGAGSGWFTTQTNADTPPNAAFAENPALFSEKLLTSPAFIVATPEARVTFRHAYRTEAGKDGGRLELAVNGGAFVDWLEAGGEFLLGGYDPQRMWTGDSGGYMTTVAIPPPAALGRSMQVRWRFYSDGTMAATGWWVDSIQVTDGTTCCVQDDLVLHGTATPPAPVLGDEVTFTLLVTNSGPALAPEVALTNFLPANAVFLSATVSQGTWTRSADVLVAEFGDLPPGVVAVLTVLTRADILGVLTNLAVVGREGVEGYLHNNVLALTVVVGPRTRLYEFAAPGLITLPSMGAATPYPSTLTVSQVAGTVSHVTVNLHGIHHPYPDDLDILLVGPAGQNTMLMSDCGGSHALVDVTLTFDDDAWTALPNNTPIATGAYQPTDYEVGDHLPPPAPTWPFGAGLSVLKAVSPNGVWRLFAYDDSAGYAGEIRGGWSLRLAVIEPPPLVLRVELEADGRVQLSFDTVVGMNYTIEHKDSLAAPHWQEFGPLAGTGDPITLLDSPLDAPQRVYRVRME